MEGNGSIQVFDSKCEDEIICPVLLTPLKDPYTLVPCGHSFSREVACKMTQCPQCRITVDHAPVRNHNLRQMFELQEVFISSVYELFCLDISSSMWCSDRWGPLSLLCGRSRLSMAIEVIRDMITTRKYDKSQLMGLVTFGTNVSLAVEYKPPTQLIQPIASLKAEEKHTRIFDAVAFCSDHFAKKSFPAVKSACISLQMVEKTSVPKKTPINFRSS